jgi:KaiC/GvpD/RAD55 family RecA-like ATPase
LVFTYRLVAATWVSGSTFTTNDKIRINATLLYGDTEGSAYVVFDNASDYSLYLNMSAYMTAPDPDGVMPFTFLWSHTNVTKSDLITLVLWSNGSSYGINWMIVRFDISPPQLSISLPSTGKYVDPSTGDTYFGGTVKSIVLSISANDREGNLDNASLFIDSTNVATRYTSSFSFPWNISVYAFKEVNITLLSWDQYGNKNRTETMVHIDNIAPSTPSLTYPNDAEEFNSTTLGLPLSWLASSDSGSGVKYYVLQLDTSTNFNSANLRSITLSNTSYSIPTGEPLSNGTWYWRLWAVDYVGNIGGYSSVRSFQVVVHLTPPTEGLPLPVLIGLLSGIPALAILSSVIFMRRRRRETETGEYDRKSLMAAYVFASNGVAMFSHGFKETKVDPQLLSGFLTAISEMMKEVVGGDKRPLRTIERSDAKILIEFGTSVTGALVTKKSSREYRRRLRAFIARFEDDYADKIPKWKGDQSVFQAASETLEEVFAPSVLAATYPTISGLEDLLVSEKLGGVAVSVLGKTGSGKTEFCLRYAASLLKRGKPVIAVAASIAPKEIRELLKGNGVNLDKVEEEGTLTIYDAYSAVSGLQSEEKYKFGSPGELNNINLSLSRNFGKIKNATVLFDSFSMMIEYSDLELAVDFVRTVKVKIQQGGHTAFFIIDSNAHDEDTLNYILHVMDGEIETVAEVRKKGEPERLVSFKRLKGFKIKPGYHEFK